MAVGVDEHDHWENVEIDADIGADKAGFVACNVAEKVWKAHENGDFSGPKDREKDFDSC